MKSAFSIKEVLCIGWEKTKKHFWFFVGVELFVFAIIIGLGFVGEAFTESTRPAAALVANLFGMVLQVIFGIGLIHMALEILIDRTPTLEMLFSEIRLFWKYLGASLLASLVSFLPLLVIFLVFMGLKFFGILSSVANIILGVFASIAAFFALITSVRLQFAKYFVVDHARDPVTSLKESFRITSGEILNLVFLGLVLVLLNLLGAVLLLVGLFLTLPITTITLAATYKKLASH